MPSYRRSSAGAKAPRTSAGSSDRQSSRNWQVAQRDELVDSARRQIYYRAEVPSHRGQIYDRSGTIVGVIGDREEDEREIERVLAER